MRLRPTFPKSLFRRKDSSATEPWSIPDKALAERILSLGKWFHRIDLGNGAYTPGRNNQAQTFAFYKDLLPADLSGQRVLDLGANACGLSIEFAKRGADVVAVEVSPHYARQAEFVLGYFRLQEKVRIELGDFFSALKFGQFDIVCYVGLAYHLRHPQLGLDMIGWLMKQGGHLLASSQTIAGDRLMMVNRAEQHKHERGGLFGWEPTERLFEIMMSEAGFVEVKLVSTSPHSGERPDNQPGNRSYFHARGGSRVPLPFVGDAPVPNTQAGVHPLKKGRRLPPA